MPVPRAAAFPAGGGSPIMNRRVSQIPSLGLPLSAIAFSQMGLPCGDLYHTIPQLHSPPQNPHPRLYRARLVSSFKSSIQCHRSKGSPQADCVTPDPYRMSPGCTPLAMSISYSCPVKLNRCELWTGVHLTNKYRLRFLDWWSLRHAGKFT